MRKYQTANRSLILSIRPRGEAHGVVGDGSTTLSLSGAAVGEVDEFDELLLMLLLAA